MPRLHTLATYVGAVGVIALALFFALNAKPITPSPSEETQAASASSAEATTTPAESVIATPRAQSAIRSPSGENQEAFVSRIADPYPFPQQSFSTIHQQTRAALINIFCSAESGPLRPISGSGVIIDARGVILTNAHVAQYILLAENSQTNLSCSIRWGSPARPMGEAEVLYIPRIWVEQHAPDITKTHALGTGEHDYALLRITSTFEDPSDSSSLVPSMPFDTREGIGFPGDMALVASYPAEFIGARGTVFGLHPISSTAPIEELLTFKKNTVDLISLGGVIGAQGGSSGGPVVNAWGRVIGVITTTSEGSTTSERELRAITLSYIDSDMKAQTGLSLEAILSGNIESRAADFRQTSAAYLSQLFIDEILKASR